MLIIGAKGFAKEVLEVITQLKRMENISFFDNINLEIPNLLYNKFPVLKSMDEATKYFDNTSKEFTLGIGLPLNRHKLYLIMESLGGELVSTISPFARVGHYNNVIEAGVNLMTGSILTNDILINKGCLINLNCTIGHDCQLGKFVELSPGVHISGNCKIGDFSYIGTNATILPKINIGKNVTVGAGSVVTKDVEDNSVIVGVPGRVIKNNPPIIF